MLFNLYMCAVVERLEVRAREADEVGGVRLLYKYDGKLFRRSTRNASLRMIVVCSPPPERVLSLGPGPIRRWALGLV